MPAFTGDLDTGSLTAREVAELVPDPPGPLRHGRAWPNYFLVLSNSCSAN